MNAIKILIIVIVLIIAFSFLLNDYILPQKGNDFIKNQLTDLLNREVNFDKVSYSLIDGIVLENFSVKAKSNLPFKYLIKSKKASFNVLLLPLIVKNKVIITNLNIVSPHINLIKKETNEFNIHDLLKTGNSQDKRKKLNLLIISLVLSDGEFNYYDYSQSQNYEEKLTDLFMAYNYSFPVSVKFKIHATEVKEKGFFQCAGYYNLRTKNINLGGVIKNLSAMKLISHVNLPIKIEESAGKITTEFKSTIKKNKIIFLSSKSNIENLTLKTQTLDIKGSLGVNSKLTYDFKDKRMISSDGDVNFKNTLIEGVPYIKKIENLEGKTTFNKEQINFKNLKAKILNCPTTFEGFIKNYQDPYLDLNIKSELKLNKILEAFSLEKKGRFKDVQIKGKSYAMVNLNGSIKKMISLDIIGDISFSDVSIESRKPIVEISQVNGKINLSKNKAEITNLTMYFKDTKYSVDGMLADYAKPHVELKVLSDNFFCAATLDKQNNTIFINKIKGNYFNNEFNLIGEVSNLSSPIFNIYGNLMLNLAELDKFSPALSNSISKLEPTGRCPVSFHFNGKPYQWRYADAGFKAQTEQISIKGFTLNNLHLNTVLQDGKIFINNFSLEPYGGTFNLSGQIDLQKEFPAYNIDLLIRELDLKKLTKDTKLKDKNISGLAFLKLNLMNPIKDVSGLYGNGTLLVTDGYLFELPLLSKLFTTIGLTQFEKVVFKEAYCDFTIKNRTISTENLTLISNSISLKTKGSVDFNGNLNFVTNAELSKKSYESLGKGGQIVSVFFNTLGKYLMRIQTTGNISNPKHEKVTVSSEELIKGGLMKGIEDILRGF